MFSHQRKYLMEELIPQLFEDLEGHKKLQEHQEVPQELEVLEECEEQGE